jgi:hypothetical protein
VQLRQKDASAYQKNKLIIQVDILMLVVLNLMLQEYALCLSTQA